MSVEWTGVERRRVTRKTVDQTVMLSLSGGATVTPCAMQNLSVLGAGILLKDTLIPSTDFDLSFDQFRTSFACRLVWHRDPFAGVEFVYLRATTGRGRKGLAMLTTPRADRKAPRANRPRRDPRQGARRRPCLLYTSDAADE